MKKLVNRKKSLQILSIAISLTIFLVMQGNTNYAIRNISNVFVNIDPCDQTLCNGLVDISIPENGYVVLKPEMLIHGPICPTHDYSFYGFDSLGRNVLIDTLRLNLPSQFYYFIQNNTTKEACGGTIRIKKVTCQSLACNNEVTIQLVKGSNRKLSVSELLEGSFCNDRNYILRGSLGVGQEFDISILNESLPQRFTYKVTDPLTGNSCWGIINLDIISCPHPFVPDWNTRNITIACNASALPEDTHFPFPDRVQVSKHPTQINTYLIKDWNLCEELTASFTHFISQGGCALGYESKILRCWEVSGSNGFLVSKCEEITIAYAKVQDIGLPRDITLRCSDVTKKDTKGNPSPDITGAPNLGNCMALAYTYNDLVFVISDEPCTRTSKIIRQWTMIDWCTGILLNHNQVIRLLCADDTIKPIAKCKMEVQEFTIPPGGPYSLDAILLDDKSYDNCGLVFYSFEVQGKIKTKDYFLPDTGRNIDVELFIHDQNGNYSSCMAAIRLKALPIGNVNLAGKIYSPTRKKWKFNPANIDITSNHPSVCSAPPGLDDYSYTLCLDENKYKPPFFLTPKIYDRFEGVKITVLDGLVLINNILGKSKFSSVYQMLAADVNLSNTVSTLDLLAIRKYILGIEPIRNEFGWELFDTDSSNMMNIRYIRNTPVSVLPKFNHDMVAVPIGDVNNEVFTNFRNIITRTGEEKEMNIKDQLLNAGETYDMWINLPRALDMAGIQIGQFYDNKKIEVKNVFCPFFTGDFNIDSVSWRFVYINSFAKNEIIGGNWLRITVMAKERTYLSQAFSLDKFPFDLLYILEDEKEFSIKLKFDPILENDDERDGNLPLLSLSPNPFNNGFNLFFGDLKGEPISIELYDIQGKRLFTKNWSRISSGDKELHFAEDVLPTKGLYKLVAKSGSRLQIISLCKI